MATRLVPEVLVVDPLDRELEQLLSACGMRTTRGSAAELAALVHPAAQQPHVVVVDTRGARAIPPSMAAVKRQHPAIGFLVVASESDPTVLLEAMRAGANEFLHEPITPAALEQAISRLVAHRASPAASGRGVRVRRRQGRRRHDDDGRERGDRAGEGGAVADAASSICTWPTATRRCCSAPSRASRSSTRWRTRTASTKRSSAAWSRPRKPAPHCWPRPIARCVQHAGTQQFRAVVEFAAQLYRYVVLDVPAVRCRRARRARRRLAHRRRHEPGAVGGARRQPARLGAARALRARPRRWSS